MNMLMLRSDMKHKSVPCWFEISFRDNPPGIAVLVHKELIGRMKNEEKLYKNFEDLLGFKKFYTLAGEEEFFGFDRTGTKKDKGEFIEVLFAIPRVEIVTDNPCPDCGGSGTDKLLDTTCFYCHGLGKEVVHDWDPIYRTSFSLSVLFRYPQMFSPDKEIVSKRNQLIALDIAVSREMGGCGIGGIWSKNFRNYLYCLCANKTRTDQVKQEAVKAMKNVYFHCFNRRNKTGGDSDFWISNENAWLLINCPGDRCGIYPVHASSDNEGCEFSCHNVDTPVQQLTLLAGLAVLHDKTREDGGHY
ncbi:MAG: hypothetical protein PHO90_02785 [Candidatus Pacebacteria bacterium]|nr:hypothetical protein [Candidatus Paceibacterota bacterium]